MASNKSIVYINCIYSGEQRISMGKTLLARMVLALLTNHTLCFRVDELTVWGAPPESGRTSCGSSELLGFSRRSNPTVGWWSRGCLRGANRGLDKWLKRSTKSAPTTTTTRINWRGAVLTGDDLGFCRLTSHRGHSVGVARECVHVGFWPDVPHLQGQRGSPIHFIHYLDTIFKTHSTAVLWSKDVSLNTSKLCFLSGRYWFHLNLGTDHRTTQLRPREK